MSDPTVVQPPRWPLWLTRTRVLGVLIGLPVGIGLGVWFRFLEHKPPTSFLPSTIGPMVVTVLVLGVYVAAGLLLSAMHRTRPISRVAFAGAIALLVGFPVGYVVGPQWQPATTAPGTIELDFAGSTAGVHAGTATCRTEENSRLIESVSGDIGVVDGVPVVVQLVLYADAEFISLVLDGASDRSTALTGFETGADRSTGHASFQQLVADDLDPDPEGSWTATAGTVRWTCG